MKAAENKEMQSMLIRIPKELHTQLRVQCLEFNQTMSEYISEAIQTELVNRGTKYSCPSCGDEIWSRPNAKFGCMKCSTDIAPVSFVKVQ